jgi:hypothetical protein
MSGDGLKPGPERAVRGAGAGSPLRQRFGYYLLGVGVGCVLVAMMWSARKSLRPKPVGDVGATRQTVPPEATLPSQRRISGEP